MDFSIQNESGGTRHSPSELGSALDLRGLSLIFSSVENIPGVSARAAFTVNSAAVFREDCDIMPSTFGNIKYMPWGADNQMPYDIIDLIERDETLATCQVFNAVPSLDLVLTPNGFGVVNTNTVAAASKQRVDRLIGSMRELPKIIRNFALNYTTKSFNYGK